MKTQGITLMTSRTTEVMVTKKATKASDSTFDNFISNNASGLSRQNTGQNASIAETKSSMESKSSKIQTSNKSEDGTSSDKTQSKDAETQVNTKTDDVKNTAAADGKETVETTDAAEKVETVKAPLVAEDGTVDIEKVNEEIMAILQDILNLMPQDLQDIFDQMDMKPTDLFTGLQTGEIQSFSIVTVQTFVMEVHGIEDPSAFLTNDFLNQEMNDIFDRMKTLLAEMMRVGVDEIDNLDESVWESFAGNLIQAAHPEETVVTAQAQTDEPVVVTDANEDVTTDTDTTPDMTVIIENQTSDNAGSNTGQNTGQGTGLGADDVRDAAADLETISRSTQTTNTQAFAEALTEAIEPDAAQAVDTQRQMTEMVDQVVRQVRIRLLPETTNMELQLHPASLGRVNVQINATGQDTTARMIVETQAAKEALESGMVRLQEAFEEKGLKVQEVEVTIGNFDLGMSQQAQGDAESDNDGQRGRNRGNNGSTGSDGDIAVSGQGETEASRRDVNSTVDYTA